MQIDLLKNEILTKLALTTINVVSIYKTGGEVITDNCKDIDYVVLVEENLEKTSKIIFDSCDYFIISLNQIEDIINNKRNSILNLYFFIDLFKEENTIYGSKNSYFNLERDRVVLINALNLFVNNFEFNENVHWENDDKYCYRNFWWAILFTYVLENNTLELTTEVKDTLKKCHDKVLPRSYDNIIKAKLEKLMC